MTDNFFFQKYYMKILHWSKSKTILFLASIAIMTAKFPHLEFLELFFFAAWRIVPPTKIKTDKN